jgi:transcriptional regulator with XRE-family HTH domain
MKTLRQVVAATLAAWMRAKPALDTQMKVAKAAGLAQSSIGRVLRGQTGITLDNLEAIASAFERDPADLLMGRIEPIEDPALPDYINNLPAPERNKITAFIQFTLQQYAALHPELLTFRQEASPLPGAVRKRPDTPARSEELLNAKQITKPARRRRLRTA